MSDSNYKLNPNQKGIKTEKAALRILSKEIDKAKKAQLGTDTWDARADRYIDRRKYVNAVEVVAKGSEAKKIDVTRKMIENLKGGDFEACDGLVAEVKDKYLNSTVVKKLILDFVEPKATEGVFVPEEPGTTDINILSMPNRSRKELGIGKINPKDVKRPTGT